uniref:Uncharacterized protein n=1 Tax=Parascaris equorum TaxID=6256 RepID=A0A914RIZ0_PAREQ
MGILLHLGFLSIAGINTNGVTDGHGSGLRTDGFDRDMEDVEGCEVAKKKLVAEGVARATDVEGAGESGGVN